MGSKGVSVVVPVYRAEGTIRELYERIRGVFEDMGREFELIAIEDCGGDGSWQAIEDLARHDERVHGIQLSRNYGQHCAVLCGLRAARFPLIVTLDDDLQHPPEEIPKLLEKLGDDYDVVYGTPMKEQHGVFRDIASRVTKLALQNAMGAETASKVSAFRAMRSQVIDGFATYSGPSVSVDVLLTWSTTSFTAVPVRHEPRRIGHSNYTFFGLVSHALNMLTGFTAIPLQLASYLGFALTGFGIAILGYVLVEFAIHGHAVPGFTFLASIIAVFSGAQLFSIGIIGEYLARMHFKLMDKPSYVTRRQTQQSEPRPCQDPETVETMQQLRKEA